jgi:hypothetical protein
MREFCYFQSVIFILCNEHFNPESKINFLSTKSSTVIQLESLDCGGSKWVFHSMEVSKYKSLFFVFFIFIFPLLFFDSDKSHISSQSLNQ